MAPRILITGATGLLGQSVFKHFQFHYETFGWSQNTSQNRIFKVELSQKNQIQEALDSLSPLVIIHTAAAKDPDYCFYNPEIATSVNWQATETISHWSQTHNCKLIFISTDSVFDGLTPLYKENSKCAPVNHYGETKFLAETAILKGLHNLVVRLPLLYGPSAKPGFDLIEKLKNKIEASIKDRQPLSLDGASVRTPTHVDDVSEALLHLVHRNISGVLHMRGPSRMTYWHMAATIAHAYGYSTEYFQSAPVFPTPCPRPLDPSMAIDRMVSLAINPFRSFKQGCETTDFYNQK